MKKIKKLHIGCGSNILPGYTNIDKYNKNADVLADGIKLDYKDNSIDEIFTSHMIEHVVLKDFISMLKEWYRILKDNGHLTIRCPNHEVYIRNWLNGDDKYRWGDGLNCILGKQDRGSGYLNRNMFTPKRLKHLVKKEGFYVDTCTCYPTRKGDIKDGDVLCKATKKESLFNYLDEGWEKPLKKIKNGKRSMNWCLNHPITKELLNSNILKNKVIDIGCGVGQRAFIACKNKKCNIVGIDGSKNAIKYATENFKLPNLKFVVDDVTNMPFDSNSFDNAYMLAVIEHVQNTDLLLSEIKRIVVPKGRIFISVTENDYHSSPDHVHSFSVDGICKVLNEFKIINIFVKDHIIFITIENIK